MPTVLDTLLVSVRSAADYNHDDAVAPAVVLWPDEKREFGRLLPRLRLALPQLLTLGLHDPSTRTGPAKCLLLSMPFRSSTGRGSTDPRCAPPTDVRPS